MGNKVLAIIISKTQGYHHSNMSYFKYFQTEVVDFSQFGEEPKEYLISDIITNVRVKADIFKNIVYYQDYDIKDGETPEMISENFYGSPYYHWVIMLTNERYDYIEDFPMTTVTLEAYIDAKYGQDKDNIKHYVTANGDIVMSDYVNPLGVADATPMTYSDYEISLNESKRRIKMIPADILGEVMRSFREALKAN
jgi:hypothetical protein